MAVYYKPQSPIQSGEDFIYPITTADQVILSDGSRLEKNGIVSVDVATAADSSKLGGKSASEYALKTDTAPDSSKLGGKTLAEIMLALYPVGAVYISVNSTSPASLFGGEWAQINGRFLIGTGAPENNDDGTSPGSYDYAARSKGGEQTHTLVKSEVPRLDRTVAINGDKKFTLGAVSGDSYQGTSIASVVSSTSTYQYQILLSEYGEDQPHNNMPPYLAVYMWKRVN